MVNHYRSKISLIVMTAFVVSLILTSVSPVLAGNTQQGAAQGTSTGQSGVGGAAKPGILTTLQNGWNTVVSWVRPKPTSGVGGSANGGGNGSIGTRPVSGTVGQSGTSSSYTRPASSTNNTRPVASRPAQSSNQSSATDIATQALSGTSLGSIIANVGSGVGSPGNVGISESGAVGGGAGTVAGTGTSGIGGTATTGNAGVGGTANGSGGAVGGPASSSGDAGVGGAIPTIMPQQPAGVPDSVEAIVKRLFDFGVTIGGIIFILMFLYGGISYLANAAEPEQAKKAKDTMIHATIGLVLVLGAWTIARFIGHELGYPGF